MLQVVRGLVVVRSHRHVQKPHHEAYGIRTPLDCSTFLKPHTNLRFSSHILIIFTLRCRKTVPKDTSTCISWLHSFHRIVYLITCFQQLLPLGLQLVGMEDTRWDTIKRGAYSRLPRAGWDARGSNCVQIWEVKVNNLFSPFVQRVLVIDIT